MMAATSHHSAEQWFRRATVRDMPLPVLDTYDWSFPTEMKPMLAHPLVQRLGADEFRFVSLQSLYKYLHDVCLTETEVVNKVSQSIAYNDSAIPFPDATCAEAFSVIIDETFHAYAARLFSLEVQRITGVKPMAMPAEIQLMKALNSSSEQAPPKYRKSAELLCCCISESTFTKEILAATKLEHCNKDFHDLMVQHLRDEGRHYSYFRAVMGYYWARIDAAEKDFIASMIASAYESYFDDACDIEFDRLLLGKVGLEPAQIDQVIADSYANRETNADTPRVKNSMEFLRAAGVLSDPGIVRSLRAAGYLHEAIIMA